MQKLIPIENTGTSPMYVAGVAIQPGETRVFSEAELPVYLRPVAAIAEDLAPAALLEDPLAELLAGSVPSIVKKLPALSDEDLAKVIDLEAEGKNRTSLVEALAAETMRRAVAATGGGTGE